MWFQNLFLAFSYHLLYLTAVPLKFQLTCLNCFSYSLCYVAETCPLVVFTHKDFAVIASVIGISLLTYMYAFINCKCLA